MNRKNLELLDIPSDDSQDTESTEDIFNTELESLISSYNKCIKINSNNPRESEILSLKQNPYLSQLLDYTEDKNKQSDWSYKYIQKSTHLKQINSSKFMPSNEEGVNIISQLNLRAEYQILKLITTTQSHKDLQVNLPKSSKRKENRHLDILPYTYNAVSSDETNDIDKYYINASYIDGPFITDNRMFIAAQGPLKNTINKFYNMCFYQNTKLIIMLCNFVEIGGKKCEMYLPNELNKEVVIDNTLQIALTKEEWLISGCLIKREILIRKNGLIKSVTHLQVVDWMDQYQPNVETADELIKLLLRAIVESREVFPNAPIVVHCSSGTGRTGTLIAIFNILKCISFFNLVNTNKNIPPFFNVFNTVRKLREQRYGMVSSVEQYAFIYKFVIEWIQDNAIGFKK